MTKNYGVSTMKYQSLKRYPGVQFFKSSTRKHNGHAERTFFIRYKDINGRLIREKIGRESEGVTAAYAFNIRAERTRAIRLGDEVIPIQRRRKARKTFNSFMADVYLPYAAENISKSYARIEQLHRRWISPTIGDLSLQKISPFQLEKLKSTMKHAGKAPRTIRYALDVVRQAFNYAAQQGAFKGQNPASQVKRPRADNRRTRFLTHDEAEALLAECRSRSKALYEMSFISLYTGMRAGEIFNLTWSDVDFDNDLINIRDPKNMTDRTAPMIPEVRRIFSSKNAKAINHPGDLIFPSRNGDRRKCIGHAFTRAVDALGLNEGRTDRRDRVTFHTLRHTFASWLALDGTPILVIKSLLGHKSLAMTERYAHLSPDAERRAVESLAKKA